jgi:hypothetical protein
MKYTLAALFICVPSLLAGASGGRHDWDRLERQEGCERYCINCIANSSSPMCMGIFHMCCKYYGGNSSDSCECRTEM